ncbi:MAG: AAA family ATPase, partial [Candidatus Neomarinimicrobiota bacterium]
MTDEQKIVISSNEEKNFDKQIRPNHFEDFIGQTDIVESLKTYITAAKQREEALDHILLYGPPGLGKTTLSNIIATE